MCGILGAVLSSKVDDELFSSRFSNALNLLDHRGPDASDIKNIGNVYLGHARLSILDLSDAGIQPMLNADESHAITYNGEIYNFKNLQEKYNIDNLSSSSDTEVVLRVLEKHGSGVIKEFNGMFSFGYYDKALGKLILVRDRAGIKPLYYLKSDEGVFFASEIKSLLHIEKKIRKIDHQGFHEWLYYGVALGERTLYGDVQTVSPGSILEICTKTLEISSSSYWKPISKKYRSSYDNKALFLNANQVKEKRTEIVKTKNLVSVTKNKLENAVKRQLVSDVPVGVFLSGGIDSSAVAAFACRNYDKKLSTYSVGFDFDKGVNELPTASEFAKKIGSDHNELHIKGSDIPDVVEKMIYHHDQPFSDAANIPLYLLCDRLRGQVKVVLQGDGGDELFAGYKRYNTLYNYKKMRSLANLFNVMSVFFPRKEKINSLKRYSNAVLDADVGRRFARLMTVENPEMPPTRLLHTDLRGLIEKYDPFHEYRNCQKKLSNESLVQQMLLTDFQIHLPNVFLEKVDKSTMAASVESRVPFLDNDLVDFCHSLSAEQKMPNGIQKGLLKKSLEGVVLDKILYGPKRGFGVPFGYWLKTSLGDFFHDHKSMFLRKHKNIFVEQELDKLYADYINGTRDNSFILWKLLNMFVWANMNEVQVVY